MSKRVVDIIPKFPQYEDFPYAGDFECPECGKSGFFEYDWNDTHVKPLLVGWCETNIGKMAVFECPECHQKFRFHCTIGTWIADIDEFDSIAKLSLIVLMDDEFGKTIKSDDIKALVTVQDILDIMEA